MAFADAGGNVVDLMVGDPRPSMLRCLHAAPAAMPDVTRIPYQLDEQTLHDARAQIAAAVAECGPPHDAPTMMMSEHEHPDDLETA
jgi:hypothetical protein